MSNDPKDTVVNMEKLKRIAEKECFINSLDYMEYIQRTYGPSYDLRKLFIKICIEAEKNVQRNKSITIKDIANIMDKCSFNDSENNAFTFVLMISGKKISEIPVDKIMHLYNLGDVFMLITTDEGNKIQFVQNDFITKGGKLK